MKYALFLKLAEKKIFKISLDFEKLRSKSAAAKCITRVYPVNLIIQKLMNINDKDSLFI